MVCTASLPVPRVLGITPMTSTTASLNSCGTEPQHMPDAPQKGASLTPLVTSYAMTGKNLKVAPILTTMQSTPVWIAAAPLMVCRNAPRPSHTVATTLYKIDMWQDFLSRARLIPRYPNLVEGLTYGFQAHIPSTTQCLPCPITCLYHNINQSSWTLYIKNSRSNDT